MATYHLPCPFCGNDKIKIHEKRRGNYRREGDNYQAWCSRCRARGPLVNDEQAFASEAWNERTPPASTTLPVEGNRTPSGTPLPECESVDHLGVVVGGKDQA